MIALDSINNILFLAEKVVYHNNLLINQKWLSAEEGNENMKRHIMEREKKKGVVKMPFKK